MNIEEIKRNLNRGSILNTPQAPQQKPSNEIYINKKSEPPKMKRPPEKLTKKDLVNDLYEDDTDEEEEKPQSQVWETQKEDIDISKPVDNIIQSLKLEEKKYDWRYKTPKGRQSRKNFTELLKVSI
jgi:hypothetical protein